MRTPSHAIPPARRARTLALGLTALLIGTAFYAHNVRAEDRCGAQADFLVKSDPLMAPVRPADCAHLYDDAPEFAWPQAAGKDFVVTVKHPDGSMTTVPTKTNWLSWDTPLPPGDYTWTVTEVGAKGATSRARRFTVERTAASS